MNFFIDTANLKEIKEAQDLGILDGVTTNPSLIAKEGIKEEQNILNHYINICQLVNGDVNYFSKNKIKTNCTLVFSTGQALLAAKAGANYVSPFIGRLDDISTNGLQLIEEIREVYDNYNFKTQILAASIRNPIHIIECAKIGADVMTGPLSAITSLLKHPLTDIGLEKFLQDYKKNKH